MDESFQLRARRLLEPRREAPLDFQLLSATLIAGQAVSPAARAQARHNGRAAPVPAEPLVEAVLAGPDWREAASAQLFCFNRAEVKRRRNAP